MKFKKTPLNKLTLFTIFLVVSSMLLLLVIDSKALAAGIYGNAVAADLLSGKTATVDAGSITGTLPNMAAYNSSVSNAVASGTLYTRISPGAYLTPTGIGYPEITSNEPNLVPSNILAGKSIFGVAGNVIVGKQSASGHVNSASGIITVNLTFVPSTLLAKVTGGSSGQYGKTWISSTWLRIDNYASDFFDQHTVKPTTTTLLLDTNVLVAGYGFDWIAIE